MTAIKSSTGVSSKRLKIDIAAIRETIEFGEISEVACYCKHVSVKITDDDVIRKDGGRRERRWEDGDEMGERTWAVEMET